MEMNTYLDESARTAAGDPIPSGLQSWEIAGALQNAINEGVVLDQLKKHLFYGRKYDGYMLSSAITMTRYEHLLAKLENVNSDILHGILGVYTESLELLEVLIDTMNGKPLDEVNLAEEIGDMLWYQAMLLRALDLTFEDCADKNIRKLKARFPEKFTQDAANNRDLEKEKEELVK